MILKKQEMVDKVLMPVKSDINTKHRIEYYDLINDLYTALNITYYRYNLGISVGDKFGKINNQLNESIKTVLKRSLQFLFMVRRELEENFIVPNEIQQREYKKILSMNNDTVKEKNKKEENQIIDPEWIESRIIEEGFGTVSVITEEDEYLKAIHLEYIKSILESIFNKYR